MLVKTHLFYQVFKTMINKTKTIFCVCALTASAFVWNATAEDLYGIYHDNTGAFVGYHADDPDNIGIHNQADPDAYTHLRKGAWLANRPASETLYTAIANDSALSFEIERNDTANGFIFGTYTVDKDGHILQTKTLGTVTSSTVGEDGRIQFKDASGVDQDSVKSDAFNANDLVGVWVQEINSIDPVTGEITYKDIVYYSENQKTIDKNASFLPDLDGVDPLFTQGLLGGGLGPDAILYFDDSVLDPVNPGMGWSGQDTTAFIKIHIQGVAPTGGPLPGVWATIALAGAASAYLRRRKNK